MSAAKKPERSLAEKMLVGWMQEGRVRTMELAIDKIVLDKKNLQPREAMDAEHTRELGKLKDAGIDLHPVVVFRIGGKDLLADGFHRHELHRKRTLPSISAYVVEGLTMHEAKLYAVSANLWLSIKRPTDEDRAKAVRMMLDDPECRTWNDSDIGRRCGMCPMTARQIRIAHYHERGWELPEKVKTFRADGTFVWMPFGKLVGGKPAIMRTRRGSDRGFKKKGFEARVSGTVTSIGGVNDTLEDAQRNLDAILDENAKRATILANGTSLSRYLFFRGVPASRVLRAGGKIGTLGAVRVPGGFVYGIAKYDTESIFAAVGRLIVVKYSLNPEARLIVICHPDTASGSALSRANQVAAIAKEIPDRIEFMTIEEVVAEMAVGKCGSRDDNDDSISIGPEETQ